MFKQIENKSVLFYRKYGGFTGGHLKVYDYFNHCLLIKGLNPEIYIDPISDLSHLWKDSDSILANYDPHKHDILFLAGNDWQSHSHCFQGRKIKPFRRIGKGYDNSSSRDPR